MNHVCSPSSVLVLAMRAASNNPVGEPLGEPDLYLGTESNYRFTRQRVKYYRNHIPGNRLSNPGCSDRPSAAPVGGCRGSADSSRSSSPEPETQRRSQTLDACYENSHQRQQAAVVTERRVDIPLSPREVVQYMLGLDSTYTSPATVKSSGTRQKSSEDTTTACQVDRNISMNSNSQTSNKVSVEHNMTSPAQKILSGLKLRRSHSGKDEQLFV